jgi:HK97 family phage portal protein
MALNDFIGRVLGPAIEKYLTGQLGTLKGRTNAGEVITDDSPFQNAAVRAAIQRIAYDIAVTPLKVMSQNDGTRREQRNHPLYDLLTAAPNARMTAFELKTAWLVWLLTWGNAYTFISRDESGRPDGLWPLRADRMRVFIDPSSRELVYEYVPATTEGESQLFPQRDILHIKGLSSDGLVGRPPMSDMREKLGELQAMERMSQSFYGNGMKSQGMFKHPANISKDAVERLRLQMDDRRGAGQAWKTLVLEEGLDYQELTFPPEQAQLLQTREFGVLEVARWFNLRPYILGVNSAGSMSYNSVEIQQLDHNQATLRPWAVNIEQAINRACITPEERAAGVHVEFNLDANLRADIKTRYEAHQIALRNGFLTLDEVRDVEGRNPYPDSIGSKPRMTLDTALIGGEPAEPPDPEDDTADSVEPDASA